MSNTSKNATIVVDAFKKITDTVKRAEAASGERKQLLSYVRLLKLGLLLTADIRDKLVPSAGEIVALANKPASDIVEHLQFQMRRNSASRLLKLMFTGETRGPKVSTTALESTLDHIDAFWGGGNPAFKDHVWQLNAEVNITEGETARVIHGYGKTIDALSDDVLEEYLSEPKAYPFKVLNPPTENFLGNKIIAAPEELAFIPNYWAKSPMEIFEEGLYVIGSLDRQQHPVDVLAGIWTLYHYSFVLTKNIISTESGEIGNLVRLPVRAAMSKLYNTRVFMRAAFDAAMDLVIADGEILCPTELLAVFGASILAHENKMVLEHRILDWYRITGLAESVTLKDQESLNHRYNMDRNQWEYYMMRDVSIDQVLGCPHEMNASINKGHRPVHNSIVGKEAEMASRGSSSSTDIHTEDGFSLHCGVAGGFTAVITRPWHKAGSPVECITMPNGDVVITIKA